MFDRRRPMLAAAAAVASLLVASGASADPINTFTGAAAPAHVKPATSASYTIGLTNDPASPEGADRAKIGIPPGFVVDAPSVQATASAAGACVASVWIADGELIADGKVNLRQPGSSPGDELCPGATLSVVFTATSPDAEGTSSWVSELLRGAVPFALGGAQPTVQVDGTAPQVSITGAPGSQSNQDSPSFEFTAGDAVTVECRLDDEAFTACASPTSYTDLADGSHNFVVKATDAAGNVGQASHNWTIDTIAPVAAITGNPSDPSNNSSPSFAFTADGPGDLECNLDGTGFAPCSSPRKYEGLADGQHIFAVRATDAAGNTGAADAFGWSIDTASPTTTFTEQPSDPSNDDSPSFSFGAGEPSQFECKLDGASLTPCASPKFYTGLADGSHTFAVRAIDTAGNPGPETSYAWLVDTLAPTVAIIAKPSELSNDGSPSFAVTADEPAQFQCKLDDAVFGACAASETFEALGDGPHTLSVRATDAAGNTGAVATYSWTIDTTAPTSTITVKPSDPSNDSSPSFTFAASEGGSFACRLDDADFTPCAPWQTYDDVADGAHALSIRATDLAGNTGAAVTYAWTIDTAAPTTTITEKPSRPSNDSSPSFGFTATEAAQFACRLDGGSVAPCVSGKSYAGLADGSHTFDVAATDAAGNVGLDATHTWVVDTRAPTVTVDQRPQDPSNDSSPSFAFTADEPAQFECRLDAAAFGPCSSPLGYAGLADGSHTFVVKANDPAGNSSVESTSTWTLDTVAPTTAITLKPPSLSSTKLASFSFTTSEAAELRCKLDEGAFAACTSPQPYVGLAEGSHTFSVKATDAAANEGPVSTHTWTVDTVAPTVTLTDKPNDPSKTSFPSFTFAASEGGTTFQCRLDGAAFASCSSPRSYANLAEVTHTFVVKATDAAGNTGPEATHTWTIDTTQPTASITGSPGNPSDESSPTFTFESDEPGSLSCKLDAGPFAPCASPKSYPGLADGAHTFSVRPTDFAGNVGASVSFGWTIDTTAPVVSVIGRPGDPTNDTSATFTFASSDASSFQCKIDGEAFGPCTSPWSYAGLPDGDHTFSVKATDSLGNTGLTTAVEWTIDTVPPTATISVKPLSLSNLSNPTFVFSSSEAGSFACRVEEGGFTPCASPKSYAGLTDGTHKFTVKATDAAGNPSAEVIHLWTIDTAPPATTIEQKPNILSNLASPAFGFTAEAGSSFACKLDTGAFEPCISPKSYSGLANGAHTFTARATDGAGNTGAEVSFTWTIDTVAPTSTIGAKPNNPTNDTTPSFSFTSESGSALTCSLNGEPFSGCTSPKSYPPLGDGPHTFAVKATDAAGNTGVAATYAWTIDTQAPTVEITSKPADKSNVKSPSFTFTADEAVTYACKLDTAAFVACSSPKPYSNLSDGGHTFNVRATDPSGNTSVLVTHAWTVDTAAPTVQLTGKPNDFSNVRSPSFVFGAVEPSTFQCQRDGGEIDACTSPQGYTNLADGAHTFRVKATDVAGNTGSETAFSWTIDTVAPTATITAKPSDPSKEPPSFSFTSDESGTFECRLDAPPFGTCTSPKTYSGVGDGSHTFFVRAIDRAGNPSAEKAYTWMLDATAPTTQIVNTPGSPSNVKSPSFTFAADQPATFECKLDAEPGFSACPSPKTYVGLPDGAHTFTVRAIDTAANTGPAKSYTWTIDTVAPTAVLVDQPSNPSNNRAPSFAFTAADSTGFLCKLGDAVFAHCTSPRVYGEVVDGGHVFTVKATDAAGNIGPDAVYAWTIKTVAATAALTSAPSGLSNSSAATFTFTAGEPSSFDCKIDDRGFAPCSSPTTYHGLADSAHTFGVRAKDGLGNLSAPMEHSWTIDTAAPETTITSAPRSTTTATSATFRFSAGESGTFECRLDGAPFALCVSPKSYSRLSRATHQFEVRAIDAAGNPDPTPTLHGWRIGAPVVRAVSALRSPRAGARVTRPPLLVWRRVTRARYYNVQLYRGRQKVLTAWPTRTRLQLQGRWKYLGRRVQLAPGSYRWYVWPGYGAPSARRYGQLLGQSTFVVARRSGR